ncbi:MAG: HupE/UreJ family protein [Cyclobacteriaceae bacterium]|nr:HupE/UreJ family protein [Cyclobacteriaceae bacterium]
MSTFSVYFQLGFEHIIDVNGYDHILFIVALCAIYRFYDWKKVLILVTAFTIGHSITLALSIFNIISLNTELIEFLIPITIFITAFSNIIRNEKLRSKNKIHINYLFGLFFGLIHGLGFSNFLKSLLGKSSNVVTELLAFNIGLEIGQIIIVFVFLMVTSIITFFFHVKPRDWKLITSSAVAGVAIMLMMEKAYW